MSVQIFCLKLCSILLKHDEEADSFLLPSYLQYKKDLDLDLPHLPHPPPSTPQSTICSYATEFDMIFVDMQKIKNS